MKCDYYNSALQAVSGLNQSVSGVNSVLRRSVEHHRVSVIWWQMNHRRFLILSPLSPYTKNTCSDYQIRHHTDNNNNNIAIVFASILAILWWVIALHPLSRPLLLPHHHHLHISCHASIQSVYIINSKKTYCVYNLKFFSFDFLPTFHILFNLFSVCLKTINIWNPKKHV